METITWKKKPIVSGSQIIPNWQLHKTPYVKDWPGENSAYI